MENFTALKSILLVNRPDFHVVVPFDKSRDTLVSLDLSSSNQHLTEEIYSDTVRFSQFVSHFIASTGATYAIGGYDELRIVYSRSDVFNALNISGEPRRRHLGTDIWAKAGTPVFCPMDGSVHSSAFNNNFGDYGSTIILEHSINDKIFYALYGHLSEADLKYHPGTFIPKGTHFSSFGHPHENGNWPPHLHFQLIIDLGLYQGDYPGVCAETDREFYLQNCPDPDLILNFNCSKL